MRTLVINQKICEDKLLNYGFIKKDNQYFYENKLDDENFNIIVCIGKKSYAKLIDIDTNFEYSLVDILESTGNFVGKIRTKYENKINDILKKCFMNSTYQSNQTLQVITYIKEKYHDNLEFLWSNTPTNAIWRHQDNQKWYGLLMVIEENKLGLKSNQKIEVINLKYPKDDILNIIDHQHIFPGYHMNKNHWITIPLDNRLNISNIYQLIDQSYQQE